MALVQSNMMPLGSRAPDFLLPDCRAGTLLGLPQSAGDKGTLIAFICNHCPFVLHLVDVFSRVASEYGLKGISTIAISSNDVAAWPEDGPEYMAEFAAARGFDFPYLYDEDQGVAKAYDAACTPDFYLFDAQLKLVYRGQMDSSRPRNDLENDAADLRKAMDAVLEGASVDAAQYPSSGCNIKWKND